MKSAALNTAWANTIETVAKIARLARIRIPEDELDKLSGELSNIIDWVEQLEQVDTDGVEPMTSVVEMELPHRSDAVTDGAMPDKVLGNAPEESHGFYVVPKVVE